MAKFLTTDQIIKKAIEKGMTFGKGDPYNRLRYYTKLGWLPHMTRKKSKNKDSKNTQGHYQDTIVDRLLLIQKYKNEGLSNDEITLKLHTKDKVKNLYSSLTSAPVKKKFTSYVTLFMILIILLSEIGIIDIGKSKTATVILQNTAGTPKENAIIIDSGTGFLPKNERSVFVKNQNVTEISKIYVSFKEDYSPASRFWVSNQIAGEGFAVELDSVTQKNVEFDWWVSN